MLCSAGICRVPGLFFLIPSSSCSMLLLYRAHTLEANLSAMQVFSKAEYDQVSTSACEMLSYDDHTLYNRIKVII